jgi:proton-dependent oligopeptide transporter, POT family
VRGPRRDLLGHPIGLSWLFATETAERFSYFGMTTILLYYMTQHLLLGPNIGHAVGLVPLRGLLEAMFGRLSVDQLGSLLFGFYTGLVYLTPPVGGLLADLGFGRRRLVVAGAVLMAAGEFALVSETLFLPGLLLLIVGNGLFKPNVATQIGALYGPGDSRVDRAYSVFYVGINIGGTLAPLICGTLGEAAGWRWGFLAAGVGVTLGLAAYLAGLKDLPPDDTRRRGPQTEHPRLALSREDWKTVAAILALCLPTALFWAAYQQQSISIAFWARDFADRRLAPGLVDLQVPATWFQSVNPVFIFLLTPLLLRLWARQDRRGTEPSSLAKMALGCALLAASFLLLAAIAWLQPPGVRSSWLWMVLFFAIFTAGELYLSPIGVSLVAKVAPARLRSMLMGTWFLTTFLGNMLSGYVGSFWDALGKGPFFLLVAAIAAAAGLLVWAFERPLRAALSVDRRTPGPVQAQP